MGQATVDLPDSIEPPPAGSGGTDELLAQLAGEEIDRLLAEADAERATADKGAQAAPPALETPGSAPPAAPVTSVRGASAAEAADAELSAQLDNLFADLTVNAPIAPSATDSPLAQSTPPPPPSADDMIAPVAALAAPAAAQQAAPELAEKPPAAPLHPVEEELRETEQLQQGARGAEPLTTTDSTLAALAAEDTAPLPLYLRPLEWINAPLDACPEAVRDIVGKVAILTTLNAISILVYVFFFRRH